jgi:hypothetical protein
LEKSEVELGCQWPEATRIGGQGEDKAGIQDLCFDTEGVRAAVDAQLLASLPGASAPNHKGKAKTHETREEEAVHLWVTRKEENGREPRHHFSFPMAETPSPSSSPLFLTLPEMRGEIVSHLPLQAVFALARTCWTLAKELGPAMRAHFEKSLLPCFGDEANVRQLAAFKPRSLEILNRIRAISCQGLNELQLAELFRSLCRRVARWMWRQLIFFVDNVRNGIGNEAKMIEAETNEALLRINVSVLGNKVNTSTFIDFFPDFHRGIGAQEDKRLLLIFRQLEARPVLGWPANLEKQELGTRLYKYMKALLVYRSPFTVLDIPGGNENAGRYSWRSGGHKERMAMILTEEFQIMDFSDSGSDSDW